MTYNPNPQNQGWVTCRDRLFACIAKWQGLYSSQKPNNVAIECAAAPRYTTHFGEPADRAVSITFTAGKHKLRTITVDRFERPVDNLWALAVGLDDIRMNELRGLDTIAAQVYQQIAAPKTRDPFEVLGLRSTASQGEIEAMYRYKAKEHHPDAGGDADKFKELTAAYELLKATKGKA